MALKRLSTRLGQVLVDFDGRQAELSKLEVDTVRNTQLLRTTLQAKLGRVLPTAEEDQVHFHRNRDGSVEVTVGKAPDHFYEDAT